MRKNRSTFTRQITHLHIMCIERNKTYVFNLTKQKKTERTLSGLLLENSTIPDVTWASCIRTSFGRLLPILYSYNFAWRSHHICNKFNTAYYAGLWAEVWVGFVDRINVNSQTLRYYKRMRNMLYNSKSYLHTNNG